MKSRKYNQFEDNDNVNNNFIDYYNNNIKEIKSSKENNNLKLSSQDDSQIIKSNQNNNSSIQFKNYKELNSNDKEEKNYNNNEEENINSNDSNVLNYNYLETEKIENGDDEDEEGIGPGSKSLEDIIHELKAENKELRNDMKKLYFLTQENKNNLIEHIQILKDENYRLKNEKKELEYRLLVNEGKNNELKDDNEKIVNANKIMQQRYLNEIKELNCQLNNYKIKLNNLTLNYDQLLNEFHFIKKEKIFQMSQPVYTIPGKNTNEKNNYEKNEI